MRFESTALDGALRLHADPIADPRGSFAEVFKASALSRASGRPFSIAQINHSVSRRGVVRGLHGVTLPPGQAKVVSCIRGALLDVVVDVRVGSPTFGTFTTSELRAGCGTAVFVAEGLAHAFQALTDDSCIEYLCSSEYVPGTQLNLHALDPDLALPWSSEPGEPLLSAKDAAAPTVARALAAGLLPDYSRCVDHYADYISS